MANQKIVLFWCIKAEGLINVIKILRLQKTSHVYFETFRIVFDPFSIGKSGIVQL